MRWLLAARQVRRLGGGTASTTSTGTLPPSGTPYQTFNRAAKVTSTLGGRAVQVNNTNGVLTATDVTGTVTHDTGAVSLNDTKYTLNDPDGPSNTGLISDGTVSAQLDPFPSTYSYVTIYKNVDYTAGGIAYNANGVAGIITKSTDVPTAGTASYGGTALGIHVAGTTETNLRGNSSVSAYFGAVNVTMNGFNATNSVGGSVTTPITEITVTGASIVGNAFDGGTVAAKNGTTAIVTGGTSAQFSGDNFGRAAVRCFRPFYWPGAFWPCLLGPQQVSPITRFLR